MLLGLDSLGKHERSGALGLGADRVDDLCDLGRRVLLHEAQVELDHIGREEGHQRERARVCADIVERNPDAALSQALDGGEHLGGTIGQRTLGELGEHGEALERLVEQRRDVLGALGAQQTRLDVDEQRLTAREAGVDAALQRGALALPLDLTLEAGDTSGLEQQVGALETRAARAARERLVADGLARVEVDERLIGGADALAIDEVGDGGRRGAMWRSCG